MSEYTIIFVYLVGIVVFIQVIKKRYIIFRRDDKWVIKAKERVDFNKINNNFDKLDFSICNPSRQKFSIITKFDHKKIQTKVKNPLCKEQKIW